MCKHIVCAFCLTPTREYKKAYPADNHCHMMNQSEGNDRGVSAHDVMYTVIANPALHYICKSGTDPLQFLPRWYHPRELLLAQGFPITCALGNPRGLPIRACSFAPGGRRTDAMRHRQSMTSQAGNSQNMHCVVVMWIYILVWISFPGDDLDDIDMDNLATVVGQQCSRRHAAPASSCSAAASSRDAATF